MRVDTRRVEAFLHKLPKNLRKRGQRGLKEFGDVLVARILQQAHIVGIKQFRANRSMFTSTRYEQKGSFGIVLMPMSGVYQDRARPHWVSINKHKPLLKSWAGRYNFRGKSFLFTPKPFIRMGKNNAFKSIMPIMRPQLHAAITESKR